MKAILTVFGYMLLVWLHGLGTAVMLTLAVFCFISAINNKSAGYAAAGFFCLVLGAMSWRPGWNNAPRDSY